MKRLLVILLVILILTMGIVMNACKAGDASSYIDLGVYTIRRCMTAAYNLCWNH